jgi:hypothetical protein
VVVFGLCALDKVFGLCDDDTLEGQTDAIALTVTVVINTF